MKTKLIVLIVLVVLASCSKNKHKSDAYGSFEATEVIISSEATGKVLKFDNQEGDLIEKNKMIVLVDTTDLYLKLQQILSQKGAVASKLSSITGQIEVLKQQKANLLIDQNRIKEMFKDQAATKKQLDDVNGAIDVLNRQIESVLTQNSIVMMEMDVMDRQIAQVKEAIKRCYVASVISGTMLTKYTEAGEVTTIGKPLFKLADLSVMKLKVYVSGAQLPDIKLNQKVTVLIDKDKKSNRKIEGEVEWISDKAEFTPKIIQTKEERVNLVYAVKIKVINDGTIKIGMPGEVIFK